jgi:hypothetical protein
MKKQYSNEEQEGELSDIEGLADEASLSSDLSGIHIPFPLAPVSGLYKWQHLISPPTPLPGSITEPITTSGPHQGIESEGQAEGVLPILPINSEELRLDVDGRYPQMVASGTIYRLIGSKVHWIANLVTSGTNSWTGNIWYKDGNVATFPYTTVNIKVVRSWFTGNRKATVTLSGGGSPNRVRTLQFSSSYFHPVNFEFDAAEGEAATLSINTGDHPNRPASLPIENLTIKKVYQRAGFEVTTSPGGSVPISGAGTNAKWADLEMHDAMQTFWSRFSNNSQWAMWVFFASLHEMGTSLGGVMFDDIGPNHRQGTAIFNDAFIATPPAGDPNPTAWVRRMIFWTACHEMGHAFNLAHSWQKQHPPQWGTPWIPLSNEPEARSFMNYPYNVTGGQSAFFSNFEFRFSNSELLFMRHAPARFVQMGNAEWFDHHGFQGANLLPEPTYRLELRVNRERPIYEFLEPVVPELKLTNISPQPQLVDEHLLSSNNEVLTIIIKKDGRKARQYIPYAQYCYQANKKVLQPGESIYESAFISAGINGFDIAEPGNYTVQASLHINGEDIVSNPLRLRIAPPLGYEEEFIAQDFFSGDVGRILAFDGSRSLESGINTLQEVTQKLGDRRVAIHTAFALGNALATEYKELVVNGKASGKGLKIETRPPQTKESIQLLNKALVDKPAVAAESLGHVDYKQYVDQSSEKLAELGSTDKAADLQNVLYETLSKRKVHGRKVLDQVLTEIKDRLDNYRATEPKARKAKR